MSDFKFELNYAGIGEMLKSAEMESIISQHASRVASQAGEGYAYSTHRSEQRVIANVYADTKEATKDNLENNTLLKALH